MAAPRPGMVALRNDYITKSTRPSRFSVCNIEKTGLGLFTIVDGANSLQVTGLISGYCLAQCLAEVWIKRR